jgi:hypothetical protein
MLSTILIAATLVRCATASSLRVFKQVSRTLASKRTRRVDTIHAGRASAGVLAFVDVCAALGSGHEALFARALVVQAKLSLSTVGVDAAPRITELVHADLSLQAVLVGVTDLQAHAFQTLLAACALRM